MNCPGILSPSITPVTVRPNMMLFMSRLTSVPMAAAPISAQVPVTVRASTACLRTAGFAVHSREKSLPPSVKSTIACTGSVSPGFTAWVAPNSRASARRASWGSTAMMVAQPCRAAAITAAKPTDPQPKTAKLLPAWGFRVLITAPAPVCRPQPSGPSSSSGTSESTFTVLLLLARA